MGDVWDDEGFGSGDAAPESDGEDDWDEGEESLDTSLEDGFDEPDGESGEDAWDDDE